MDGKFQKYKKIDQNKCSAVLEQITKFYNILRKYQYMENVHYYNLKNTTSICALDI